MLRTEAVKAVSDLYAKFANPREASDALLDEWHDLAQEFEPAVWTEAVRQLVRHTKFGSPNLAEMNKWCVTVRAARRAESVAGKQVTEGPTREDYERWSAECERDRQRSVMWAQDMTDGELEAFRDRFMATGRIARNLMTKYSASRRDEGPYTAADIRSRSFLLGMLHGHAAGVVTA